MTKLIVACSNFVNVSNEWHNLPLKREDISKSYYIAQNHLKQFTVRYEVMSLLEFYESNSKPEMWQILHATQKN